MSNPVDLQPREWAPNREPVRRSFGAVAGEAFAKLITAAVGLAIFICVMALGLYAKGLANEFIYGAPAPKSAVAPGNYQWTPDKGLRKID